MSFFLHAGLATLQHGCNVATLQARRSARLLQHASGRDSLKESPRRVARHGVRVAALEKSQQAKNRAFPVVEFQIAQFLRIRKFQQTGGRP